MEQRHELRIKSDEPVSITRLNRGDGRWSGRFVDLSDDGIRIKLDSDLEVGSLLKLETDDDLMVAEVRQSESEGAEYCTTLSVLDWMDKAELERLIREAVMGPSSASAPEVIAA
jgi:hypothetical protein